MGMSDCRKCWDTPCTCGYEYKDYTTERLINFVLSTISYKTIEEQKEIIEKSLKILNTKK